jgi:hypothetical protein
MRTLIKLGLGILTLATCSVLRELPAEACGGCFHEPPNPNETPSVVTDHRMAFSVSKTQTTLWDQVRYAGDPKEFAWVLPVRAGTIVQVARDEFLTALENATAPTIAPPQIQCYYPPSSGGGGGGGGGFGCSASTDATSFAGVPGSSADAGFSGADGGVQIISQSVVGPYEAVVLRSSQGQAITDWLQAHNFAIPSSITPVLSYYSNLSFDFVAIRLRPNVGVRAMQPIRVVSPGADATLPLRMVAAGVGQSVGIELFVLSEGRYEATTFDNALIDPAKVKWDSAASRSTYTTVFDTVTSGAPKGTWVTEYAGKGAAVGLQTNYKSACLAAPPVQVPCPVPDAGAPDAGGDAGDAGVADAGPDDGGCFEMVPACTVFDDYDRATDGMNLGDITITRMRTNLPTTALSTDLVLGAAKLQTDVSNRIQTTEFVDPSYNPCPGGSTTPYGPIDHGDGCDTSGSHGEVTLSALSMLGLGLAGVARRLRRRR